MKKLILSALLLLVFLGVSAQKEYKIDKQEQLVLLQDSAIQCKIIKEDAAGLWLRYKDGFVIIGNDLLKTKVFTNPIICQAPASLARDSIPEKIRTYSDKPAGWKVLIRYLWETEIPGALSNFHIQHIIREADRITGGNFPKQLLNDELFWCTTAILFSENYIGNKVEGLDLSAISFLNYGERIDPHQARIGDIVILWRKSPERWESHVGYLFGFSYDRSLVYLLGGNQSNQINIASFDAAKIRKGGIRRPPKIDY